jgi:hypothetical protein
VRASTRHQPVEVQALLQGLVTSYSGRRGAQPDVLEGDRDLGTTCSSCPGIEFLTHAEEQTQDAVSWPLRSSGRQMIGPTPGSGRRSGQLW